MIFPSFSKEERIRVCCFGCWVGRSLDQSRASRDKKVKAEQRRDQTVTVCEDVDCRGGGNNLILQLNKTYSASPNITSYISCSSGLSNPTGPKCYVSNTEVWGWTTHLCELIAQVSEYSKPKIGKKRPKPSQSGLQHPARNAKQSHCPKTTQ